MIPQPRSDNRPLLDASGLSWSTPEGRRLFHHLDFQLFAGQILLITGPNGSGKSTLLGQLLEGLEHATTGGGILKSNVDTEEIAYIPQLQSLEFHLPLTLSEVIEIDLNQRIPEEEITRFRLLNADQLNRTWNTASGGERQRTLLTCVLLNSPRLLILDEPFNHLDNESQNGMLEAVLTYLREDSEETRAVILVSHLGITELEGAGVPVVRIELGKAAK